MNKRVDYICFLLFTHTHLIVATTNIKKKYGSNAHLNLLYYFLDCTKNIPWQKIFDKSTTTISTTTLCRKQMNQMSFDDINDQERWGHVKHLVKQTRRIFD